MDWYCDRIRFYAPFFSVLIAAGCVLAGWSFIHSLTSPLLRLIAANGVLFGVYFVVFWFVMGQKEIMFQIKVECAACSLPLRSRDH